MPSQQRNKRIPPNSRYRKNANLPYTTTSPHPSQKLDLYFHHDHLLFNPPVPLVVYIHGGAFKSGDKVTNLLPLHLVTQHKYALASINYRLSGEAPFPAAIEDCKSAIRYLRAKASHYNINAGLIVAMGEGAGAYCACMLGVTVPPTVPSPTTQPQITFDINDNITQSSHIQAAIIYYGPTDFLKMDSQTPGDNHPSIQLHSTPDSPESLFLGHPITKVPDLVAKANPITYIPTNGFKECKYLVAHGMDDHIVPFGQSVLLVNALKRHGMDVVFLPFQGVDHGWKGITQEQKKVLDERTEAFLKGIFGR